MISLRSGSSEATLLPHLGGAIGSFSIAGRPILRPTPEDAIDPLETASFPLVPYANRIADGRFTFAGQEYSLPRNVAGFAHPLHGLGWLKTWSVESLTDESAVLTCAHDADGDWPWDWNASQHVELTPGSLRVLLEVTNHSARTMPCGIGHHPYFVRPAEAKLRFAADGVWLNDAGMVPAETASADSFGDFAQGALPDAARLTDNCWFGWTGSAALGDDVLLSAPGQRFLHVFAPPGEDFICLEPTSTMPDAFNRDAGLSGAGALEPGASMRLGMTITVKLD